MSFSVILNIKDMFICNCLKNTNTVDTNITSTSQSVNIQNNFKINVVNVNQNYITVVIQNGNYVIIRRIYTNYSTSIAIPTFDSCSKQILTLNISSININE